MARGHRAGRQFDRRALSNLPDGDRQQSRRHGLRFRRQGRKGDGEANHGDLDGDGYAGEDWYNGHDDDGDGLIDEDYWFADGLDNAEPFTDSNNNDWFDFIDTNQDSIHQGPEPFFDTNDNFLNIRTKFLWPFYIEQRPSLRIEINLYSL